MLTEIKQIAEELMPRLKEIRRHLHSHPELSGQEHLTAIFVAGVLSSYELHVQENVGKTGLFGELQGQGTDSRQLAIRVDMDALPIHEQTGLEFASKVPGVMHACGHDVHTTVGLGTAMVLSHLKEQIPGNVRFIFQPAEEIGQGAMWMIKNKALENVSAILSLHVFPTIPAGSVGIRYGSLTASLDSVEITIIGQAADAGNPKQGVDAIWVASQVIISLQQAISRMQDPQRPVVLTIGKIRGGYNSNTIADRVKLVGTARTLHPEVRARLAEWVEQVVAGVCHAYGAEYELHYHHSMPSVVNYPELTQLLERAATEALGNDYVQVLPDPSLGSEDFAEYLNYVPGAMFRLGVGYKDKYNYPLHHPKFDVDETSILAGVMTLAYSVCQYFQGKHI
ncbi:MAG: amidohydrolase [Iphinoe sp. HA4291-MV1]|nr:amidohydrolase [Iphinoe sp. HA4291-MV1]